MAQPLWTTVGVWRWVLESTMSMKSLPVGTICKQRDASGHAEGASAYLAWLDANHRHNIHGKPGTDNVGKQVEKYARLQSSSCMGQPSCSTWMWCSLTRELCMLLLACAHLKQILAAVGRRTGADMRWEVGPEVAFEHAQQGALKYA